MKLLCLMLEILAAPFTFVDLSYKLWLYVREQKRIEDVIDSLNDGE